MSERVGWTRRYILRHYGKKAFKKDGNLKITYLRMAKRKIEREREKRKTKSNLFALRAITEAINFKS